MKRYDAIIAGYLCVDLIPEFIEKGNAPNVIGLFKPGKLIEINGIKPSLGGVVANTGIAMKKFNKKVFLNGLVGADLIGKIATDWLDKDNLSEGIRITETTGTAFSIVISPPGIDRIFLESPGCNKIFDTSFIDFEAVSQSRLFHFGYPPLLRQFYLNNGSHLLSMFSRIQGMGVITSMDFSLPDTLSESGNLDWCQILQRVFPYTDIFVPSLEEILQVMMPDEYAKILSAAGNYEIIDLTPIDTIREIGEKIINSGVKILLIKAGHRGIYLLTGNVSPLNQTGGLSLSESWNFCELWCNAYPVDPDKLKNATGAGDTAAAAFLTAILDSETPETALKYAAIAGRNNLYCLDINEDLSGWQDMKIEAKSIVNDIIYYKKQ